MTQPHPTPPADEQLCHSVSIPADFYISVLVDVMRMSVPFSVVGVGHCSRNFHSQTRTACSSNLGETKESFLGQTIKFFPARLNSESPHPGVRLLPSIEVKCNPGERKGSETPQRNERNRLGTIDHYITYKDQCKFRLQNIQFDQVFFQLKLTPAPNPDPLNPLGALFPYLIYNLSSHGLASLCLSVNWSVLAPNMMIRELLDAPSLRSNEYEPSLTKLANEFCAIFAIFIKLQ
uniref:Uncharacterized protein n=1 Tax=Onchocerca volvulus TaxID=6282 RepID=A0A8R1U143_ONCVO